MATKMRFLANAVFVFIIFFHQPAAAKGAVIYNVESFGAISDGGSNCTAAFLSAWAAACATAQPSTIYVPRGHYLLAGSAIFSGKSCKNINITLQIDGTLVAPSDYNVVGGSEYWIKFDKVNGLSIFGGTLDGQGAGLWSCKKHGKNCPKGAASLGVSNSNNVVVSGLTSLNSQFYHIILDYSHNISLFGMTISAASESPNTDGIHVQMSSAITIMNSHIGTGDDCISISPGCSNFWAENISCGPGHGLSIGSLGLSLKELGVQNVTIKTVTFIETDNGVRIKTWALPSSSFVQKVVFQNVTMVNVKNPIIIDQNYCPNKNKCPHQDSGVRISDVKYQDVHGSSATKLAVKFDCSKAYPCNGIILEDVNLSYKNQVAMASCVNAVGSSVGVVNPESCLS